MRPIKTLEQETRVLNLYTRLMRATNTVTEKMHKPLQCYKLSISQFGVLEALYHLGPLSQKDIGDKILKTSGNITMVIDNLEKRDLVKRAKDPDDRRRLTITLTGLGQDLIKKIFPGHSKTALKIFSVLEPEEQHTLGLLLKKLGTRNK
ncbi:MAG: MarR family transcriptional regulator [Desulfobacula sp.]|jgi:MarR family 2-MHQ and catechol resistance regulon transcriptional repressor|uniref:MarR family winged helix-turn-helix transcriptional regulator n=1 Tax=Desulfobacula sp. TaxID=2593537 RepID=UPI001D566655|nr:MarR family transcriptional regulator [Desulfobacula sp.]MBT3484045.1 MarR family transcriptional regulator [Desulfobacula sp.]MBT3805134.1 MarR family transcriptional regulator [Desulfobacula sp.]MBT4026052.1 MarR family transcriptional regulator [Desulfobacula sp.]MBT4199809.1 MarR family transcriptional regulator [Desulfobacula sp.]